jgi:hypothetical protein
MDKKYHIKYRIILEGASPLENKEIKIAHCMSGLHAQTRLEEYLKRKYINFKRLEVSSCKEHNDLSGMFGDIFGPGFPSMFGGHK